MRELEKCLILFPFASFCRGSRPGGKFGDLATCYQPRNSKSPWQGSSFWGAQCVGLPGCIKLSLFFKVAFLGVAVKSWWIQHSSRRRRFLKASMHRLASLSIWLRPVCEEWEIHRATRGIRRTVTMHPLYELNMVLNFLWKLLKSCRVWMTPTKSTDDPNFLG